MAYLAGEKQKRRQPHFRPYYRIMARGNRIQQQGAGVAMGVRGARGAARGGAMRVQTHRSLRAQGAPGVVQQSRKVAAWVAEQDAPVATRAERTHRRWALGRRAAAVMAIGAGAWLVAAVGAPDAATAANAEPAAPTASVSWAGRVVMPVVARTAPKVNAKVKMRLSPTAPLAGGSTILGITRVSAGDDGRTWVEVDLPVRPNGSRGWLPADDLDLSKITTRVAVSVGKRQLTLYRSGRVVMRTKIAVGVAGTPTPLGTFTVAEMIRSNSPKGALGPVILPLTAHSPTLTTFAGGNGRVAMHGTNAPQLLGTRASNGCIRLANSEVMKLARLVRPGTPVIIGR